MKFFHIDNNRCHNCGICGDSCPTGAVLIMGDDKRHIDYDRCTHCGTCMKVCAAGAVSLMHLTDAVREMDNMQTYRSRIRSLETELSRVRQRAETAETYFGRIIESVPVGVVLVDAKGRIVVCNNRMREIFAVYTGQPAGSEDHAGSALSGLLPGQVALLLRSFTGGENIRREVVDIDGSGYCFNISAVGKEMVLIVAENISDKGGMRRQLESLLQDAVSRKMDMVRRIGTIIGEETSAEIESLNNALQILTFEDERP